MDRESYEYKVEVEDDHWFSSGNAQNVLNGRGRLGWKVVSVFKLGDGRNAVVMVKPSVPSP